MIYWLCLLFCISLTSSFAYPPFHNMPEVNPFFPGPYDEENYGEYSDSRFDPQWSPWHLNSQPEMHPFRSNFVDSGMKHHYDQENMGDTALRPLSPHYRNLKFNNILKTKRPTNIIKPYQNYQSNNQQDDSNDYETDEDTELRRHTGNKQLPSAKSITTENSFEMSKDIANEYENRSDDGSFSNVYPPKNSPKSYSETANKYLDRKNSNNIKNRGHSSDSFKIVDITTESVAYSSLNSIEDENSNKNSHGEQSSSNVHITDEALSDATESISSLHYQNEGPEYTIDKSNDIADNHMQDDGQSLEKNSDSASNNINNDEYSVSLSKQHNDKLRIRDTNSDINQNYFSPSVKLVKNPRTPIETKISQAVPKLTFYNEHQSGINSGGSEFTSEKSFHFYTKRMTNDRFKFGGRQLQKHRGMENLNEHQSLNHKAAGQSAETDKIQETPKDIFSGNEDDKISTNYQMKDGQQNKQNDPQKIDDVSLDRNVGNDALHDYTKTNQDTALKANKPVDSKTIKALEDSGGHDRHDSFKVDINDPNLSKKRSVDISDVSTEKGSAIYFQRYFGRPYLPEMKATETASKTVLGNSQNKRNKYSRQHFQRKKHFPSAFDTLSDRKLLHHSNPNYPYAEHKYSKYDSSGRNPKQVPEFSRPTGLEVKELDEPHNYELNIARQWNNKKAKVDEKLSRTMEDFKIKKTILKDANTQKETNIVENEKEKVVDKVHVITDPHQKTSKPPPEAVNVPFLHAGPVYPYVDQSKGDEEESPEAEVDESDTGGLNIPPDQQILAPSGAEEELEQAGPQNAAGEDDYGEQSKENVVSENYYDFVAGQEDEGAQKIPMSPNVGIKTISNNADPTYGFESSEAYHENYDDGNGDDSQISTEIPPVEDGKPIKGINEYLLPAKQPLNFSPPHATMGQIHKASPPPPEIVFQDLNKSRLNQQQYKPHFGNGNKHKKIYHFSTEYAVSYGMDEFEKEEKLEKASKTVVRNKLMTANESSHHFQEKKTQIKNNKESYHEAYVEEKDENKFPREMDSDRNPQRSIAASNRPKQSNADSDQNPNPDYSESSVDDKNSEFNGNQDNDYQPGIDYSGPISDRNSPSDELKQHEDLIDNVKRNQPSVKISRNANIDSFTNQTLSLKNLHDGRREASSLHGGESDQETHQKYSESNLEDSPNRNIEIRDSTKEIKGSGTPSWTVPHSESKSGNVVYITMKTTTMDLERKYHDFIQIQDGKRSPGRYERNPKHRRLKRKKNGIP